VTEESNCRTHQRPVPVAGTEQPRSNSADLGAVRRQWRSMSRLSHGKYRSNSHRLRYYRPRPNSVTLQLRHSRSFCTADIDINNQVSANSAVLTFTSKTTG